MGQSTEDKSEQTVEVPGIHTADTRLSSLLDAIETEAVPDRLLRLANELQRELVLRRQKSMPN